jgi:hypothetical protein
LYDESPSPLARNYDAVPTLEQCGDCKKANKPGDLCEAGLCKGCCDGISCWPAPAPDAVADAAALGDAGYYKVRRFKQAQLQLAPVAPVESPIADTLCDHPMLICSAGYSLIEDFSYVPVCPDCGKLVRCGHRGFCPELCGCDDYLARYPPDY